MPRTDLTTRPCSMARTLGLVGERWTLLILRDAFLGARRFEHFQSHLGIARNILSDRLGKLVDYGLLERRPYSDRPVRHEYRLTDKSRDLFPVLLELHYWGDKWAIEEDEPPFRTVTHRACGRITHPVTVCAHCGGPLTARGVKADPIPKEFGRT